MEYSIPALARLAGVSSRTLRWYDEKGLLKPSRVGANGYRYYGGAEVDRLQDILLLRSLGVGLAEIRDCLNSESYDRAAMLGRHCAALHAERERIERLLCLVNDTIGTMKGKKTMNDKEKFEALKRKAFAENEANYGAELREKYDSASLAAARDAVLSMTEESYGAWKALESEICSDLTAAVRRGEDPAGEAGRRIAEKHARWLTLAMGSYDAARHRDIAELYVCDERFAAYYDREETGCARFLCSAVGYWAKD